MPGAVRGGHDAILEMLNLHDRSMERLGTGADGGANASTAEGFAGGGAGAPAGGAAARPHGPSEGARSAQAAPPPFRPQAGPPGAPDEL